MFTFFFWKFGYLCGYFFFLEFHTRKSLNYTTKLRTCRGILRKKKMGRHLEQKRPAQKNPSQSRAALYKGAARVRNPNHPDTPPHPASRPGVAPPSPPTHRASPLPLPGRSLGGAAHLPRAAATSPSSLPRRAPQPRWQNCVVRLSSPPITNPSKKRVMSFGCIASLFAS